jgi:hypothetical protein
VIDGKLINSTPDASVKAAIMVLFDGGPRSEEFAYRFSSVEKIDNTRKF